MTRSATTSFNSTEKIDKNELISESPIPIDPTPISIEPTSPSRPSQPDQPMDQSTASDLIQSIDENVLVNIDQLTEPGESNVSGDSSDIFN